MYNIHACFASMQMSSPSALLSQAQGMSYPANIVIQLNSESIIAVFRTVIVTAAVHRGFDLKLLSLRP